MDENIIMNDDKDYYEDYTEATKAVEPLSNCEIERHKPIPSFNHGSIQANLIFLLKLNHKKKYRTVSELTIKLDDWLSVPDLCIYPFEKLDLANDVVKTERVPLCTIEILSPKQSLEELLQKARDYFKHGVKSCWIVIAGLKNVYVFSDGENYEIYRSGEILKDTALGIEFEVGEVFE